MEEATEKAIGLQEVKNMIDIVDCIRFDLLSRKKINEDATTQRSFALCGVPDKDLDRKSYWLRCERSQVETALKKASKAGEHLRSLYRCMIGLEYIDKVRDHPLMEGADEVR